MRIQGTLSQTGLNFGEHNSKKLRQYAKDHPNTRVVLETLDSESKSQRGFLHGAVYALWAYLNDMDWTDSEVLAWLHEKAKEEFNGEMVKLDGKLKKRGKSTKGMLNEYTNRVIDYLEENYGIDRFKVLNTSDYKYYRDTIYPDPDAPDTYIAYLQVMGKLK